MKTKLEMAHEYAIALINSDCEMQFDKFIRLCWNYADAMQAEADKRNYSEKQDSSEWQPDWSQAPEWANWWCLSVMHGAMWFSREPICTKSTWVMLNDVKFCATSFDEAPSFNYPGNWQDSLRKRPQ